MNVKSKQCLLYVAGYNPGPLDGIDGPKTKAAMQKVFEDYGVGEDGLIGILAGTVPKRKKSKDAFWRRIHYFSKDEFRCPCGRCDGFPKEMDETVVFVLDRIREEVGKPIIVSSGVRCPRHNAELKGSVPDSLHLEGKAIDFCCRGMPSHTLLKIVQNQPEIAYSYIIDDNYIHMNVAR